MEQKSIIYCNGRGEIKHYRIGVVGHDDEHIEAIHNGKLKTFRHDSVLEWIGPTSDAESRLAYWHDNPPEGAAEAILDSVDDDAELEVCFTGFSKADKVRLSEWAADADLDMRSSVTRDLFMLCCGPNAGPSKINAAQVNGAYIVNEQEFMAFVNDGVLPEVDSSPSHAETEEASVELETPQNRDKPAKKRKRKNKEPSTLRGFIWGFVSAFVLMFVLAAFL